MSHDLINSILRRFHFLPYTMYEKTILKKSTNIKIVQYSASTAHSEWYFMVRVKQIPIITKFIIHHYCIPRKNPFTCSNQENWFVLLYACIIFQFSGDAGILSSWWCNRHGFWTAYPLAWRERLFKTRQEELTMKNNDVWIFKGSHSKTLLSQKKEQDPLAK